MASAFDLLWIAFIFLFDVRVMGFDVLPDVVGYVLIMIGLKRLASLNGHLATAAKLAPVVALVSLADFYQPPAAGASLFTLRGTTFKTPVETALTIASILLVALNLFLVYHIVTGIVELAKKKKEKDLVEAAAPLWGEYKTLHIMIMIILPIVALFPAAGWLAPTVQLAAGIVVYFSMIGFLRDAQWDLFGPKATTSDQK